MGISSDTMIWTRLGERISNHFSESKNSFALKSSNCSYFTSTTHRLLFTKDDNQCVCLKQCEMHIIKVIR